MNQLNRYHKKSTRRAVRTRGKIARVSSLPRLSVFRSNKHVAAQIIDDTVGKTLAAAFGKDPQKVGQEVAEKAVKAKVSAVVFDRGPYNYHGQVKLLAEAARAAGLKF